MILSPRTNGDLVQQKEAELAQRIFELESTLENESCRLELAQVLLEQGQFQKAVDLLQPMLRHRSNYAARQLNADVYYRHDQFDIAQRLYHESLVIATEDKQDYWVSRARDGLAWVLIEVGSYYTGEFRDARASFQESLEVYTRENRFHAQAMCRYGLSRALAGCGEYTAAIEQANESLELLQRHQFTNRYQYPLYTLAATYRDDSQFDAALPYFEKALDHADEAIDPFMQVTVSLGYGICLEGLGRLEDAIQIWLRALPIADSLGFPKSAYDIYCRLASAYAQLGRYEEAYRCRVLGDECGHRLGLVLPTLRNHHAILRHYVRLNAASEIRLGALVEGVNSLASGLFVFESVEWSDPQPGRLRLKFVNQTGAQMLGRSMSRLISYYLSDIWPEVSFSLIGQAAKQVYETGDPYIIDHARLGFVGLEEQVHMMRIAKTQSGVVCIVSDVTEREKHRSQLEEINARLTALDRDKSELLQVAAHDLRSPLANIHSLSSLIEVADDDSAEFVQLIQESATTMLGLIQNLLDNNRIETGRYPINPNRVNLCEIVSATTKAHEATATRKHIGMRISCPSEPIWAKADGGALRQVIDNLVSNALKFSHPGSEVTCVMSRENGTARFEVSDTGPGIAMDEQAMLFQKYAKLTAKPTAGEPSSGLGLSIAKTLMESMGGQIGCVSELGHGATFWFTVPLADSE